MTPSGRKQLPRRGPCVAPVRVGTALLPCVGAVLWRSRPHRGSGREGATTPATTALKRTGRLSGVPGRVGRDQLPRSDYANLFCRCRLRRLGRSPQPEHSRGQRVALYRAARSSRLEPVDANWVKAARATYRPPRGPQMGARAGTAGRPLLPPGPFRLLIGEWEDWDQWSSAQAHRAEGTRALLKSQRGSGPPLRAWRPGRWIVTNWVCVTGTCGCLTGSVGAEGLNQHSPSPGLHGAGRPVSGWAQGAC